MVEPYILDFYCPEAKLAIEVDGELHALRLERDRARDEFLAKQGILVLRIPSLDVFSREDPMELQRWLDSIQQYLIERTGVEISERSNLE